MTTMSRFTRLSAALAFVELIAAGSLAAGGVIASTSASAVSPVRIRTLGDSITGSPGWWRALLWQRLQQTGCTNLDMVGTLRSAGLLGPVRRRQRGARRRARYDGG
jgi:hypothetical protein